METTCFSNPTQFRYNVKGAVNLIVKYERKIVKLAHIGLT